MGTISADVTVDLPLGVGRLGRYTSSSHTHSATSESATNSRKCSRKDDNDYYDNDYLSFPEIESYATLPQNLYASSTIDVSSSSSHEIEFKQCTSCDEINLQHSKFCCSCGNVMSI